MSLEQNNINDNNYIKHEIRQRSPDITQQRQNSPEFEREIYEKWLKKCKEDANYSRQASEKNNFDRIKFEREVLNRVGQIPDPEKTKLYTPYMQNNPENNTRNGRFNQSLKERLKTENEYDLYTLDGFPRHNYAQFYENGYGIKRGGSDITNLAKYERLNNGTYDEYRAKQRHR